SDLVAPELLVRSRAFSATFGWQLLQYRRAGWLLVNIPSSGGKFSQFLYNPQIPAPDGWFQFEALNGNCWAESAGDLYFGGQGTVYQADTGTDDAGDAIAGAAQWAWSQFNLSLVKSFKQVRPYMRCSGVPNPLITMLLDYATPPGTSPPVTTAEGGAE